MLMLAAFVIAFAFFAFFVFAATFMVFAAFVIAFAFVTFFVVALMLWHVGFYFLHFLCHADEFCSLVFVELIPISESLNYLIHASHHFRAHTWLLTVVIAFMMMLVALFFLVLAAFFVFCVFLFFAA